MSEQKAKEPSYYQGLNTWLLRSVPDSARLIVEVGCAEGRLGAALKRDRPDRRVLGVEREAAPASAAATRLDEVFQIDIETDAPPIPDGTVDCLLFGDVLEHLRNPLAAIRRMVRLLRPDGVVLCCVPNVQHYSVVTALLRGEFQYQPLGIMDETHLRFFTYSSFAKLLFDAGLDPDIVDRVPSPPPLEVMAALGPALAQVGADPALAQVFLGSYQYIFRAQKLAWEEAAGAEEPLSFVACVNDEAVVRDNLLSSPCLQQGTPHEVIQVRGATSAAQAFAAGLERAAHPVVVLLHQDVYLPAGWPRRFLSQWRLAEERLGRIGVAGVYGARFQAGAQGQVQRAGHIFDRYRRLRIGNLPELVDTLDEVVLAFPKDTPLRLDPALGFHNYGSDAGCAARRMGLRVAVLDAPCVHNSSLGRALPAAFYASQLHLREKWQADLPIATNCGLVA